jgi:hypothetical protein
MKQSTAARRAQQLSAAELRCCRLLLQQQQHLQLLLFGQLVAGFNHFARTLIAVRLPDELASSLPAVEVALRKRFGFIFCVFYLPTLFQCEDVK